jgi:hypothetical protein
MKAFEGPWGKFSKKYNYQFIYNEYNSLETIHSNLPGDTDSVISMVCYLEAYKQGFKCISPSLEQLLAFEQIDPKIPVKDYQQIFPTTIIKFSQEYQNYIVNKYKTTPPHHIIIHKPIDRYFILSTLHFGMKKPETVLRLCPKDGSMTVEEGINRSFESNKEDKDFLIAIQVLRATINLNLFMVNFGYEKLGYENIKRHRYLERNKPLEAKKDLFYYALKQNISIHKKEYIKNEGNGTHDSPKPHWRRGHYRNQPYGPALSLRKMKFIKPVFVCPENFKGKLSDTEVTYS